jgi:hypothetical protein
MLIIDNDNLNILNLYIALKNKRYPVDVYKENLKTLKFEELDRDIFVNATKHERSSAGYSPFFNIIIYEKGKKILARSLNHELFHAASSRCKENKKLEKQVYKYIEYYPVTGIESAISSEFLLGNSLNEGFTELLKSMLVNDNDEESKNFSVHPAYKEMMDTMCLLAYSFGFDDVVEAYLNNDCALFYQLMEEHLGEKWFNILCDIDTSFDFHIHFNGRFRNIGKLLTLKYDLEIIKGLMENSTNLEKTNGELEVFYNLRYADAPKSKKLVNNRIKKLNKKYSKRLEHNNEE